MQRVILQSPVLNDIEIGSNFSTSLKLVEAPIRKFCRCKNNY